MKVGNEDSVNHRRSYVGVDKLSLGAFSGVEQQSLVIPAEEVAAVVAEAGGLLAGAAEYCQVANAHDLLHIIVRG